MMTTGFTAFDQVAGLAPQGAYLLHGPTGAGKTALALSFLAQGLEQGEPAGLITDQSAETVIAEARRMGIDLAGPMREGRLVVFEYPESAARSATRLLDDTQIVAEFRQAMAHLPLRRLVLDPVTPLLAGQSGASAAARFETLRAAFSELRATTLYLADTNPFAVWAASVPGDGAAIEILSGDTSWIAAASRAVTGSLRAEPLAGGRRRLVLEKWSGDLAGTALEFELAEGVGLVSAGGIGSSSSAGATSQAPARKAQKGKLREPAKPLVLVISGIAETAAAVGEPAGDLLRRFVQYEVQTASGAGHGIALAAESAPDAIVLSGLEQARMGPLASRLRSAGHNMPLIAVCTPAPNEAELASLLEQGLDVCLPGPAHGRLLVKHVDNLLRRAGRLGDAMRTQAFPRPPRRLAAGCTTQPELFLGAVEQEHGYNQSYGLPTLVFTMRPAEPSEAAVDLLATAAACALAGPGLVLIAKSGIAVLLADAVSAEPFLNAFGNSWPGARPLVEPVSEQAGPREALARVLALRLGLTGRFPQEAPVGRGSAQPPRHATVMEHEAAAAEELEAVRA